ncbi:hypothetical protein E2C01_088283 [Portunus trituberculatus]|uniref:Uncharacterized protein n=1 Tax=Portunus trituberculatus TaxID=210409 RepID=A0A5B7J5Q3_PORTR|nr:hypothetical protein [Portunus trituberculatus]
MVHESKACQNTGPSQPTTSRQGTDRRTCTRPPQVMSEKEETDEESRKG